MFVLVIVLLLKTGAYQVPPETAVFQSERECIEATMKIPGFTLMDPTVEQIVFACRPAFIGKLPGA